MFQGREYVYAVYKEGGFSKAAKRLCISQPSLSANVKRIENKIGYPLFDRSRTPVALTECGEKYIQAAEYMMRIESEFANYINDWGQLKTGSLVIGASSLYAAWVLPALIGEFSGKYPQINVELLEENTQELITMLQNGRIDIMLDNCHLDSRIYEKQVLRDETLFLAVPRALVPDETLGYEVAADRLRDGSWKEHRIRPVPLAMFERVPFLLLKPENDTCKRAMSLFHESEISPQIVLELDQQLTSFYAACSGMGAAFVSDTLIAQAPVTSEMAFFGLSRSHSRRKIKFYWKAGRYLTRAMEEFMRQCLEMQSDSMPHTRKSDLKK